MYFSRCDCCSGARRPKSALAFADGGVGLDHLASEARDLEMIEERVVQRGRTGFRQLDGNAAEVERVKDLFDEMRVILRDDAAGVAGLVGDGQSRC